MAELRWEPSVNAAQIGVEVTDGIVTLAGTVDSFPQKWDAEQATQRVAGVRAITVDMAVRLPSINRRTDVDIARSAENALQWTSYLPHDCVKVKVEDGWITLSGEVSWEYQRRAATTAVRSLLGVTGVSDQIGIQAKGSPLAVKAEIESALKRRAEADLQTIHVEVDGADVTLSGTVHSWAQRQLANHAAWGAPGVNRVVDHLTIVH